MRNRSGFDGRTALELGIASFIVLFQELLFIRWLAGQVRVLAYFPNLILLSSFLGLGLGCLRAGRRSLLWAWPPVLFGVVAAAAGLSRVVFTQNSISDHLWLLYYDLPPSAPVVHSVQLPIVLLFAASMLSFVPLGQIVAERLLRFQERSSALAGYCFDIIGSLIGVIAFTLAGFLHTFPVFWFSVILVAGGVFFVKSARSGAVYLAIALATLWLVVHAERASLYSPYYAIKSQPGQHGGVEVLANGSLHQYALGLRSADPTADTLRQTVRTGYHFPHKLLAHPPRRALVLGAGTGNDVSVLLDEGAESIDAVEIDPEILRLGVQSHPDRPYDSPRVRVHNTDARSFLNQSRDRYDLIVFGTLDSMTRLSALSNVRLDNFVYTLDCLEAARKRLTEDGGVVMYFMVPNDTIDMRLTGMLTQVFGEMPLVRRQFYVLFNKIYMAGPAFFRHNGVQRRQMGPEFLASKGPLLDLPSDDWPFLYLGRRSIGRFYREIIAIILVFALVSVGLVSRTMRAAAARGEVDWEMLLFGIGFMVLETRSVTQMSLVWGATWLTSAVVFGSILAMILAATLFVRAKPLPWKPLAIGLTLSLILAWLLPPEWMLQAGVGGRLGLSVLFVGGPIFFASTLFAIAFRDRPRADTAFGWNLVGAVAGGLLEFSSMVIGLKALLFGALLSYSLVFLIRLRRQPTHS